LFSLEEYFLSDFSIYPLALCFSTWVLAKFTVDAIKIMKTKGWGGGGNSNIEQNKEWEAERGIPIGARDNAFIGGI
jgi:hypothetical protein